MELNSVSNVYGKVAQATLFRNVYTWMSLALLLIGLTSLVVVDSLALLSLVFGNRMVFWGLLIAELALVWYVSARINQLSFMTAGALFVLYSVLNGATLSVIFLLYTAESIASTFFITAGTFGVMSLIGYFTKKDLSSWGNILFMGLIGLIIASIVNIFLKSEAMYWILSYAGVLIFVGLTMYDTQKIKRMLSVEGIEVNDSTRKIALMGALTLYLDFINLFLYLLRILGNRK
ncbi:MAG: Bax inhibitor-1/YccA family protein [Bacteroides sp.]|nr:Bax inhibitor-1/YccA family protein [Bacteroides sp.]